MKPHVVLIFKGSVLPKEPNLKTVAFPNLKWKDIYGDMCAINQLTSKLKLYWIKFPNLPVDFGNNYQRKYQVTYVTEHLSEYVGNLIVNSSENWLWNFQRGNTVSYWVNCQQEWTLLLDTMWPGQ